MWGWLSLWLSLWWAHAPLQLTSRSFLQLGLFCTSWLTEVVRWANWRIPYSGQVLLPSSGGPAGLGRRLHQRHNSVLSSFAHLMCPFWVPVDSLEWGLPQDYRCPGRLGSRRMSGIPKPPSLQRGDRNSRSWSMIADLPVKARRNLFLIGLQVDRRPHRYQGLYASNSSMYYSGRE